MSESSIGIDFYYKGVRCRERIKLEPTPRNLAYVRNLRGQIQIEIAKGTFDYTKHFPNSARALIFAKMPGTHMTIQQGLEDWYNMKVPELEHSTLIGYRRIIDNVLVPFCGAERLTEFTRLRLKALVESLGPDVTAKRINNVLGPLRGMFAEARADELIESNPCAAYKIKRRRKVVSIDDDDYDVDPFTPAEVAAILKACSDEQFRNFCQFNFATGLRMSEMIGLWWPRCDLINDKVRIMQAFTMGKMKSTKTESGQRDIDLLPPALEALKAQKRHSLLKGEAVFLSPLTGEAWTNDQAVRKVFWTSALKRAGVRYRAPKQMRHTFASQALSAGENIMWVARQLGHKHWTVTARYYARWIPSVAPDAGAKISALWTGTDGQ